MSLRYILCLIKQNAMKMYGGVEV